MVTGKQIRAARSLLGWTVKKLADCARVSVPTIQRIEGSPGTPSTTVHTLDAITKCLEAEGIEFFSESRSGNMLIGVAVRIGPSPPETLGNGDTSSSEP